MKNKGFTLIELLVVIAIIGILSSVVLASLNTARNKGSNAAIKSQMSSLRQEAELYYDNNGYSYASVCTATTFGNRFPAILAGAVSSSGGASTCSSVADQWSASVPLKVADGTFTHWCVDNTGASKGRTSAAPAGGGAC